MVYRRATRQLAPGLTETVEADNPVARGTTPRAPRAQVMDSRGPGRKEMHARKGNGEFHEESIFNEGDGVKEN